VAGETGLPFRSVATPCAAPWVLKSGARSQDHSDSISYGLEHREEALNYAMQFAREWTPSSPTNSSACTSTKWTLGYGEKGQQP